MIARNTYRRSAYRNVGVGQIIFRSRHFVYFLVQEVFCVLNVLVAIMTYEFSVDMIFVLAGTAATVPHADVF